MNTVETLSWSSNIGAQILNVGAWARGSERVPVSLPRELEDFIPEVRQIVAETAISDQYGGNNYLLYRLHTAILNRPLPNAATREV
jgi:hypothetical protein